MITSPKKRFYPKPPRCLLVAGDPLNAGPIIDGAAARGLALDAISRPRDLVEALEAEEYRVIALRVDEGVDASSEHEQNESICKIRLHAPTACIVGLGTSGTMGERTIAGRIGFDRYVQRGEDAEIVLDAWEDLLRSRFHAVLLDTDDEYLRSVEEATEGLNCGVTLLPHSTHLVEELARLEPELLVLRKRPVGCNVIELLRALRSSETYARLPVLLISDREVTDFDCRAYAAGADGIVGNPTPAELGARLGGLLSRRAGGIRGADRVEPDKHDGSDVPAVVVVADDDPGMLEMLEYVLGSRGHRIDLHTDGRQALTALLAMQTRGRRPVVLLDVNLPGLDGTEVMREINRARPGQFQVIMTTWDRGEATRVRSLQAGAIDCIVKPVRMPIVLARVTRLLEGAGTA